MIAVTSSLKNEGKTTITYNISQSLAEIGKKVLFIDTDLRMSVLAGKFNLNRQVKGLSHYLSNQATLEEIIYKVENDNLHVILAGPHTPNPATLIDSNLFKNMIEHFRKMYDYIIIDTPPLGSVIDAAIISQESDEVAVVVVAKQTPGKIVKQTVAQLRKVNANILGVILNKVDMQGKEK